MLSIEEIPIKNSHVHYYKLLIYWGLPSMQDMLFFLDIVPPTTTAQEKKVSIVHGKPIFYEPKSVKQAKLLLKDALSSHIPTHPLEGPLELVAQWYFPRGKTHKHGEWRSTRPDTDNLDKLLKDCMTDCGYWKDDAQVVREVIEKRWSDTPGIMITIRTLKQ